MERSIEMAASRWYHLGEWLCMVTVEVSWDWAQVGRVTQFSESIELYLGDGLEISGHLVVTLWGETVSHCWGLKYRALQVSEVYSGDCPKMAGHSALILGGDSSWSPLRFLGTQVFELLEPGSGDGLEMTGCWVMTLGEETQYGCYWDPSGQSSLRE